MTTKKKTRTIQTTRKGDADATLAVAALGLAKGLRLCSQSLASGTATDDTREGVRSLWRREIGVPDPDQPGYAPVLALNVSEWIGQAKSENLSALWLWERSARVDGRLAKLDVAEFEKAIRARGRLNAAGDLIKSARIFSDASSLIQQAKNLKTKSRKARVWKD